MKSKDIILLWVCDYIYLYYIYEFHTINSPYLLVFGDDRVIRYTGADDVAGGTSEV